MGSNRKLRAWRRPLFIRMLARGDLAPVLKDLNLSADELTAESEFASLQMMRLTRPIFVSRNIDSSSAVSRAEGLDREFEIRPQQFRPR